MDEECRGSFKRHKIWPRGSPSTDDETPLARQDPLLDRFGSARHESPLSRSQSRVEDAAVQNLGEVEQAVCGTAAHRRSVLVTLSQHDGTKEGAPGLIWISSAMSGRMSICACSREMTAVPNPFHAVVQSIPPDEAPSSVVFD